MTETWDTIAVWYAEQLRAGSAMHEFSRDILLDCLPKTLAGQQVLDLGCGEGIITRALAARGARALGIDPFPRMIEQAQAATKNGPPGARYAVDDGCTLATVATGSVDWVTAGLSLNNVPELSAALTAVRRVLVPGGRLVFTIPHPCFDAPHATWTAAAQGRPRRVVGDYHVEGFWRSDNSQGVRRAGNQHRMLSTYLTTLVGHGFLIEATAEPTPSAQVAAEQPQRAGLPPFFLVRASSKK
ncbi:Methyltransferase domain-containing protein [Streptomyces sp. Ag82_O1-12]|uniref:class I SAM-dependent methyltransferase n=1 Tax=unclassified Streptomyces TaxID=2593676 RepID=UPI000BD7E0B4|nr:MULTISPECIES: class I SAM-dependent methyltransferase [unclassified Streptomyces]SMQ17248.1 Methyltransferase domain-containing protein [Streptomyces sp. Ag82_O1-12]SOD46277.1 Methyltransferase domain-containing protein [Streptomyces sp. Ag82_G6-1]